MMSGDWFYLHRRAAHVGAAAYNTIEPYAGCKGRLVVGVWGMHLLEFCLSDIPRRPGICGLPSFSKCMEGMRFLFQNDCDVSLTYNNTVMNEASDFDTVGTSEVPHSRVFLDLCEMAVFGNQFSPDCRQNIREYTWEMST